MTEDWRITIADLQAELVMRDQRIRELEAANNRLADEMAVIHLVDLGDLRAQNAKLRAALEPFLKLGCSDINCRFRDNDYGTNGGCCCARNDLKARSDWRIAVVKLKAALEDG